MAPRRRSRLVGRSCPTRASADQAPAEERILQAAVELFARFGYSGTSTRDIARRAKVNDASIYRYFASKRELFTAALDRELQPVSAQLACPQPWENNEKSFEAIRDVFHLIADLATQRPELMRLMQFSALEFGVAMKAVYRKHLGNVIGAIRKQLQRRSEREALPRHYAETTVLSFIFAVVAVQNFYPVLAKARLTDGTARRWAETCADLWYSAVSHDRSGQQAPSSAAGPRRPRL